MKNWTFNVREAVTDVAGDSDLHLNLNDFTDLITTAHPVNKQFNNNKGFIIFQKKSMSSQLQLTNIKHCYNLR